jgi:hypothetical protein
MGLKNFETSVLPDTMAFACAMRMPLLVSASTELGVASARGCAVGGAAGMGASSMPLACLAQTVLLNEPANAGRARSAMFANAI